MKERQLGKVEDAEFLIQIYMLIPYFILFTFISNVSAIFLNHLFHFILLYYRFIHMEINKIVVVFYMPICSHYCFQSILLFTAPVTIFSYS